MNPRRAAAALLIGDFVCLAGFVLVGMGHHDTLAGQSAAVRFGINAGPLALAWAGAAMATGALRLQPLPALWGRTLLAWLVAAPLGLLLRALLLQSAVLVVAFVLVTSGLGGALLLAWRTLFGLAAGRLAAGRPGSGQALS